MSLESVIAPQRRGPELSLRAHPDPRTVLLFVLVANLLALGPMTTAGVVFAEAVALGLLLLSRRLRTAAACAVVFVIAWALLELLLAWPSGVSAIAAAIGFWTMRFTVCVTVGAFALAVLRPAEVVAALRAMRVPQAIVIPFAVLVRMIPAVAREARAIAEAMALRGVRPSPAGLLLHPVAGCQLLLIPLLMTVIRGGDEFAAAGILRGLGAPGRPTSLVRLRFRAADAGLLACALEVIAAAAAGTVLR